jgi:glucuronate isomerase
LEDLSSHIQIAKADFDFDVLPTFRSDELFNADPDTFTIFLDRLAQAVSFKITSLADLTAAIDRRIDFFHEHGCRLSDFGMGGQLSFVDFTDNEVDLIFSRMLKGESIGQFELDKYRSFMFLYLGRKYHEKSWAQQYHLGAIRNNNSRLKKRVGSDVGCDSIGDYSFSNFLSGFFDALDRDNQLAKTITYNLNPSQNEVFATMLGNFNDGTVPGKMQWGAAWWFLDQKDGIEKHLDAVSNMGLLSRFVGMITDSRSFLSFPRHEYFRRILCNVLARDVNQGLIPEDQGLLKQVVENICYSNARRYFEFDPKP